MSRRSKDIRDLLADVERQPGWRIEDRPGGYRIFPPAGGRPMSAPHGPRHPNRAIANLKARLRRAGAEIA